jgi:hypothetical protein
MIPDAITTPFRIATTLEKRREGEDEPYETLTDTSWHEPDGTEITDQQRIDQLEAAQRQKGT